MRDPLVTGVQTCALPISQRPSSNVTLKAWATTSPDESGRRPAGPPTVSALPGSSGANQPRPSHNPGGTSWGSGAGRSEERRVGKESGRGEAPQKQQEACG